MQLPSRKHDLILEDNVVIKRFNSEDNFNNEFSNLVNAYNLGLRVPKVLNTSILTIEMSYIEGTPLNKIQVLNDAQITAFCDWIHEWHMAMKKPRGDMNRGNFIWDGEKIWSVDFADPLHYDYIEHDVGSILAFLMMDEEYDQIPVARKILKYFMERQYDVERIEKGYLDEIDQIVFRKKKYYDIDYTYDAVMRTKWPEFLD